jgi:hypothetical protein
MAARYVIAKVASGGVGWGVCLVDPRWGPTMKEFFDLFRGWLLMTTQATIVARDMRMKPTFHSCP